MERIPALDRTLEVKLAEGTYAYGAAFEHFLVAELHRLNDYAGRDWRFSYLRTKERFINITVSHAIDSHQL